MFGIKDFFDKFRTRDLINSYVERPRLLEDNFGNFKNFIEASIIRKDGSVEKIKSYNMRTTAGALWQANMMCGTPTAPANYIALSTEVLNPSLADTTLNGEITSQIDTGLVRTQGQFSNFVPPQAIGGNAIFQVGTQFLSAPVGTPQPGSPAISVTVKSAGMFDAPVGGNLFVQANFDNPAIMTSGDRLVFSWVIGI